ncbi:MAG TPA: tRNA guanosine(34) transglycosylase Tgt [Candidatus Lustribacter sp.]|jgi:queuine tRNA-ribosyltransferase|nr:tRNA guanosine(34) transglycosylase Tgt [Candidatus Lustribacter sp.]
MIAFALRGVSESARRGTLTLAHGSVETPAFMPVGTGATVKGLTPADLREIGAQIVLANTYHLWLRPGRETLVELGGLHRFMAWDRPILTDSGGFQVFSLESRRRLDDDGVTFQSHLDGSTHRFTPENVVEFQEALGVDIAMMLDVCVKLPAAADELAASVRRTTLWARRGAAAWQRGATALFGIVQGGTDQRLREESARELVALDLPGYAVGGLSVGESREELAQLTRFTAALLPAAKPRYLMGVGTVRDLIAGVDGGVDMFDCVYPTRAGRHGRAITRTGEYNIRNAAYARDDSPVDPQCSCMVCTTFTRAYLSHLFRSEELLGPRLLSYHNLAALAALMADARAAIEAGRWAAFRDGVLGELAAAS